MGMASAREPVRGLVPALEQELVRALEQDSALGQELVRALDLVPVRGKDLAQVTDRHLSWHRRRRSPSLAQNRSPSTCRH